MPTYREFAVFGTEAHDFPGMDTGGTKHVRARDRYLWSGFKPDNHMQTGLYSRHSDAVI